MSESIRTTRPIVANPDDPEELMLDLGPELCEYLGWAPGDVIEWTDNKDGTWTINKKVSTSASTTTPTP